MQAVEIWSFSLHRQYDSRNITCLVSRIRFFFRGSFIRSLWPPEWPCLLNWWPIFFSRNLETVSGKYYHYSHFKWFGCMELVNVVGIHLYLKSSKCRRNVCPWVILVGLHTDLAQEPNVIISHQLWCIVKGVTLLAAYVPLASVYEWWYLPLITWWNLLKDPVIPAGSDVGICLVLQDAHIPITDVNCQQSNILSH